MMKHTVILLSGLLFVSLFVVALTHANIPARQGFAAAILSMTGLQTATSSPVDSAAATAPSITDILQQLQDQELRLTTDVADVRAQMEGMRLKSVLNRILRRGDSGDDVKTLQTLLGDLSGATSTSATGFYGAATEKSVKAFQTSSGLKSTGIFDTDTRDALISSAQSQTETGTVSAKYAPTDLSSIIDPQQSLQSLQDQISQLTAKISDDELTIADLQNQVTNLESGLSSVQSNVTTLSSAPAPVAAPLPLAISNIQISNITKTSATVTWTTNNPATDEIDYSQNSSMPVSQTLTAKSSTMTTTHSVVLSSLTSGTTYYYRIISVDSSNTVANSSTLTFLTLH